MKLIATLFFLLISLYSVDFFPDLNVVDVNNSFVINPKNDSNPEKLFVSYDINTSETVDLNATIVENLANRLGIGTFNRELNVSKAEDLKGYVNSLKFKMPSSGNSIANQLKTKVGEFDSKDPSTYSKDAILAKDNNSSEIRAIKTMKDFYDNARSRVANLKTLDCYATRKLTNSYYCPLPSLQNSFFKGGSFKDDKDKAKEDCEGLCKEPSSCLYKDMNKDRVVTTENVNKAVEYGSNIIINADVAMLGKFIQVDFNTTFQYDANISPTSTDYNITKVKKALKDNAFFFRFDVSYFDNNQGSYVKFITEKSVLIDDVSGSIKIYLDVIKSPSYRIDFYDTYKYENNTTRHDSNLTVNVKRTTLEYVDNKYWFCSASQFVENASYCKGEIKDITIGSEVKHVCVTEESKQREPEYGAYYTQAHCNSVCMIKADCVPTYRHLTSYDPLNLPSELKDIEIDCVSTPTNTSCTKQACIDLFTADTMPLLEKSWTNDDNIKITVANGVQQTGLVRPRIDVAGGLSANGNEEERSKTSLREMSEISYANMLETGTYNVSINSIKEPSVTKSAYKKLDSSGGYSISWILKPNSFDIDDNKQYYLYSIMEIDTQFRPLYGTYVTSNGIQSGTTDPNIAILDKVYLMKTLTGYKVIRRVNNFLGKFKEEHCTTALNPATNTQQQTCTSEYKWGPIDAYKQTMDQTFINGGFADYSKTTQAPYFTSQVFSSDVKFQSYLIFDSLSQISNIEGVLFNSQSSINRGTGFSRIYSGEKQVLEQSIFSNAKVYGFYSSVPLTYNEVFERLTPENAFYSTNGNFPTKIIQDGSIDNGKVEFYVAGKPDNMSVNIDFIPDSNEEGKRTFIYMLLYGEE